MQPFVIAILALVGLLALGGYLRTAPATLARHLPRIAGGVLLGAALMALLRGSTVVTLVLTTAGLWLMASGQQSLDWLLQRAGLTRPKGRTSRVETETLDVELDLDTGDVTGRVLKGFFAGRRLEKLRPVELAHLWQDCRFNDPQSAGIVEAYLDRVHPTWRDDLARAEAEAPKGPDGKMTAEEALDILGLAKGATADEIRKAHRALMMKLHPDRGGSTYLAAKINEAKDVLLAGE